ncbi:MAG: hypothetical protein M1836_000639 [Candelina mexicana]|nr:MAG: hypothetical protein M1836_000639 [Candelina mexicana]
MAFVSQHGDMDKKARIAALTIVTCLYMMSLLPLFMVTSAAYLFAAHVVDQAIGASEVLIVTSSVVSLCYILAHSVAAGRQMQVAHQQYQRNGLHTSCFMLIRLMVTLWFATSAASLVVSLRQPMCIQGAVGSSYRISGGNCILQKTSVAVSLLAFFTSCALFFSLEISDQPFESHLLGITKRSLDEGKILRSVSCNSSLASDFERDTERCDNQPWQPRGMFPSNHPVPFAVPALPPRPSSRLPDLGRAQGTKPSSRALPGTVPSLPPVETRMPLNWGWSLASIQSVPSQRAQPQVHSSALRNCSKSHSPTTSIASSQNSFTMSVMKSPVSPARSTRSIPRRSPLSTMRRVSNPDVPIYEEFTGKRSQSRLKKCWDSTKTLDNGDGRKELGNARERTLPQNETVASPALEKSLGAAATPGQTQYRLQNAPGTPRTLSSVEIPNLAASLTDACDTVQQGTARIREKDWEDYIVLKDR